MLCRQKDADLYRRAPTAVNKQKHAILELSRHDLHHEASCLPIALSGSRSRGYILRREALLLLPLLVHRRQRSKADAP